MRQPSTFPHSYSNHTDLSSMPRDLSSPGNVVLICQTFSQVWSWYLCYTNGNHMAWSTTWHSSTKGSLINVHGCTSLNRGQLDGTVLDVVNLQSNRWHEACISCLSSCFLSNYDLGSLRSTPYATNYLGRKTTCWIATWAALASLCVSHLPQTGWQGFSGSRHSFPPVNRKMLGWSRFCLANMRLNVLVGGNLVVWSYWQC